MKTEKTETKLLIAILTILAIIAVIIAIKELPILAIFLPALLVKLKWKTIPELKKKFEKLSKEENEEKP